MQLIRFSSCASICSKFSFCESTFKGLLCVRGSFPRFSFCARIFGNDRPTNRVEEDGVYSNPVISSGIDLDLLLFPLHFRVGKTLIKNLICEIFFGTHKNLKFIVQETWNEVWSKE